MKTNLLRSRSQIRRQRPTRGQTLVEYALILAFVSVVAIAVLKAMSTQVKGVFTTVNSQLAVANAGGVSTPPAF